MASGALAHMRARARAVHGRAAVKRWQYRQRALAAGVWFRLRRALAAAQAAYAISQEDARRLVDEGYPCAPCGNEIAPPKTLVFVNERRLSTLASRRQIPVALGPDFLLAETVALVPFEQREGQPKNHPTELPLDIPIEPLG